MQKKQKQKKQWNYKKLHSNLHLRKVLDMSTNFYFLKAGNIAQSIDTVQTESSSNQTGV